MFGFGNDLFGNVYSTESIMAKLNILIELLVEREVITRDIVLEYLNDENINKIIKEVNDERLKEVRERLEKQKEVK